MERSASRRETRLRPGVRPRAPRADALSQPSFAAGVAPRLTDQGHSRTHPRSLTVVPFLSRRQKLVRDSIRLLSLRPFLQDPDPADLRRILQVSPAARTVVRVPDLDDPQAT